MPGDPNQITAYRHLSAAWNQLMEARQLLNHGQFLTATDILKDLDELLLDVYPKDSGEPVPMCDMSLSFEGTRHERD